MFKKGTFWAPWLRAELKKADDYGRSLHKKYSEVQKLEKYKPVTYQTFMKYIYYCHKLGLISKGRTEPTAGKGFDRQFYVLVTEKKHAPEWINPKKALYGD